jgi:hypothetical protein
MQPQVYSCTNAAGRRILADRCNEAAFATLDAEGRVLFAPSGASASLSIDNTWVSQSGKPIYQSPYSLFRGMMLP